MKPTVNNACISQKPFHGQSGSHTSATESARYAHRKVKKQSGLLNALNSIISYVKNSFRALEDFICESCAWRDLANAGRDIKHNANKTYIEQCKAATTSKKGKMKYQAMLTLENARHKVSEAKGHFSRFFES